MDENGILEERRPGRVALRVRSREPYSAEFTAEQIGAIADVAEHYGSGAVHVTARQAMEIPHIEREDLPAVTSLLAQHGLVPGSTGNHLRNVSACSRWCLYNARPVSDLARTLNALLGEKTLPGKTTISLSGCAFSCVRSRTSDIGVIARTEIEITDKKCKHCSLCVKDPLGCQMDALTLTDDGVVLDRSKCVGCGFCSAVCRPGTIAVKTTGFSILVGGNSGMMPREAVPHSDAKTEDEVIATIRTIVDQYRAAARNGERIGDVIARLGLQELRS